MAISKIILNGVTQMDVTGKTVTAGAMRNGVTALKNDGTDVTGNIPDMTLPSASSSTSSGTSKATITPTSSAQYLNIPTGYNATAQYYTIAAASGGASNFVTGTFTGTTTGSTLEVTVPYSGSGYPVAIIVAPTGGIYGNSTYSAAVARYAIGFEAAYKTYVTSTPTYSSSGDENMYSVTTLYKSSTSSATNYSTSGTANIVVAYGSGASPSGATQSLLFRSNKSFGVRIYSSSSASNRGFLANVEYTYHVIYSS